MKRYTEQIRRTLGLLSSMVRSGQNHSERSEKALRNSLNGLDQLDQLILSSVKLSLDFAEWIDINGIRDGRHEWKYKGDNYSKQWTTQQMFDEWQKVSLNET